MQTAATAIPLFVSDPNLIHQLKLIRRKAVGRVFAGLGVGIVSTIAPMYQSEW